MGSIQALFEVGDLRKMKTNYKKKKQQQDLSAETHRHHNAGNSALPSRLSSIHDDNVELLLTELVSDTELWRLNSFTTNARASGVTPVKEEGGEREIEREKARGGEGVWSTLKVSYALIQGREI